MSSFVALNEKIGSPENLCGFKPKYHLYSMKYRSRKSVGNIWKQ